MQTFMIVVGVVVLTVIFIYNSLVSKKNQVENIFGSIDAILKKRYDLIPSLVATAKEYMEHEKSILEDITALRSQALNTKDSNKKIDIDKKVTSMLGSFMIAVENYPELKANENLLHLQHSLNEIEEQLSAARRAYNQAVTDYNNAIEMFPSNIVANYLGYRRKHLFEIEDNERKNVDVKALFDEK